MPEALGQPVLDSNLDKPISAEEKALKEVEKTMPAIVAPETALPAIRFSLFNFFILNPNFSTQELDTETIKLSNLGTTEELYKLNSKIPTVGIEVEFPKGWISPNTKTLLNEFGIKNELEPNYTDLWEVNPRFSYSPGVQSRILQELKNSDIIKNESENHLSLHINVGAPDYIKSHKILREIEKKSGDLLLFAHATTFAFSSSERLRTRKRAEVLTLSTDDVEKSDKDSIFRLELKAQEFNDKKAFRAISEIQTLSAALFSKIKTDMDTISEKLDNTDKVLIKIWNRFVVDFIEFTKKYKVPAIELNTDWTEYRTSSYLLFKNETMGNEARLMFSKYAREVKRVLFPDQNPESEE